MIIGSNSREQIGAIPMDLRRAIDQQYGVLASRASVLYKVDNSDTSQANDLYGTPIQQWVTDTTLRCSAVAQGAWHADAGNVTFEYEFAPCPRRKRICGRHSRV